MANERFMKQHYGASGFVPRVTTTHDPLEKYCLAAVKFCEENELNYTLGQMRQMAIFAQECCEAGSPAQEEKSK